MDSRTAMPALGASAEVWVLLSGAAGGAGSQADSEIGMAGMIACTTNNRFNVAGMRSALSAIFS
jgi:hypothetical protein